MVHYCAFELVRSKKSTAILGLAVQFVAGSKNGVFRDDSFLETFLLPIGSMVLVYIVT